MDRTESLFLTVSENHFKREYPEEIRLMSEPFVKAGGYTAAYEGAILGAADLRFDLKELGLWLKRYRLADYHMDVLLPVFHICMEYAARHFITDSRQGVPGMGALAATELLRLDPIRYKSSPRGWVIMCLLLDDFPEAGDEESRKVAMRLAGFEEQVNLIRVLRAECAEIKQARALVEQAVRMYKDVFIRYFAPDHSADDLPQGVLSEEVNQEDPHPPEKEELVSNEENQELKYDKKSAAMADVFELTEEQLAVIPEYLEHNFGPSFQTQREADDMERAVCKEVHEERKLLLTDGLPQEAYEDNSARADSLRACLDTNRQMVDIHQSAVNRAIRSIEQIFMNAINLRNDPEIFTSDRGQLNNGVLWKVGRVENPKLFQKVIRQDGLGVVVELLIDASGSQAVRASMVAMQSYIFSAALSRIGIPHRVMSYCTYGNYTVLRRFRDYDDPPATDFKILEYRPTSNNRDGLALAAAGMELLRRSEENKIMIVFSDGLPNDMMSGRKKEGRPKKYVGDTAVNDTCFQVRKIRREGAQVIGIFLGDDDELENERMIYGSSFLRIRQAEDFSGSAGKRLGETLLAL